MMSSIVTTPAVAPNSSTTTSSLLCVFRRELERVGDRGRLRDEMGLLHELLDEPGVLVVGLGLQQVAVAHDPHDVVHVLAVDRHPAEGQGGMLLEDLGDRGGRG